MGAVNQAFLPELHGSSWLGGSCCGLAEVVTRQHLLGAWPRTGRDWQHTALLAKNPALDVEALLGKCR